MRRLAAFLVIAIAAGAAATTTPLSPQVQDTLTTIDVVPTQAQVASAFGSGSDATMGLISIAQDTSTGNVGVRLRAIRALASFCPAPCDGSAPHQALLDILGAPTVTGADILVLRAALESLGQLKVQTDLGQITPFLDHPSRDVRATAAFALRDLCNTYAIQPLRTRLQHEATAQVQLAISSALRVLGQTPLACTGP